MGGGVDVAIWDMSLLNKANHRFFPLWLYCCGGARLAKVLLSQAWFVE